MPGILTGAGLIQDPELMLPYHLAVELRNLIALRVANKDSSPTFPFRRPLAAVKLSLLDMEEPHVCGGKAVLYLMLLSAFRIRHRWVGIFNNVDENVGEIDGHASVEIFSAGRWIAMDPSFNCSFRDDRGRPLSWGDVNRCFAQGSDVHVSDDGVGWDHLMSILAYRTPISELSAFVYASEGPLASRPELWGDWDGYLSYASGLRLYYPNEVHTGHASTYLAVDAGPDLG